MNDQQLREAIIETVLSFQERSLSVGTSGNASVRNKEGFLITPTGIAYNDLTADQIVAMTLSGDVIKGDCKPSSEWHFHLGIYQARPEVNAIVHVHSPYATGLACNQKSIPAFHYMIARAGGNSIQCAEYATFGSEALSSNAVAALEDRMACLLANHGQISLGENLIQALSMAEEVEELAKQYCLALQFGEPILLDDVEMKINLEKFKTYGKQ